MQNKLVWIDEDLNNLKEQGLYKNIRAIQSAVGPEIVVDGKSVLNFCSNNYLGFANHPELKKAAKAAVDQYGVGTTAVRTISGTMALHLELERKLASFKKAEGVISFQSGLIANLSTVPVLVGENDVVFSDELNHASIIDGCKLSKATVIKFKHGDVDDLGKQIKTNTNFKKKLIITDGVFSMDGDVAPLDKIVKVAERFNCMTMVDDAHGEGVLGESGRGIVDHYHLHGQVDVEVGTLSKAFGVIGGFVAGKKVIVDYLRQKARPFLFSSAVSPADVGACVKAVEILEKSDALVKSLWANAGFFKDGMKKLGFDIGVSTTPITPVMLGDVKLAVEFAKKLFEKGIFVVALGYPTVPMDKARIRVMVSAAHTQKHLNQALQAFGVVGRELKVI